MYIHQRQGLFTAVHEKIKSLLKSDNFLCYHFYNQFIIILFIFLCYHFFHFVCNLLLLKEFFHKIVMMLKYFFIIFLVATVILQSLFPFFYAVLLLSFPVIKLLLICSVKALTCGKTPDLAFCVHTNMLQHEREIYTKNVVNIIRERLGQTQWSQQQILRYLQ
jgi:hypothetical protein